MSHNAALGDITMNMSIIVYFVSILHVLAHSLTQVLLTNILQQKIVPDKNTTSSYATSIVFCYFGESF